MKTYVDKVGEAADSPQGSEIQNFDGLHIYIIFKVCMIFQFKKWQLDTQWAVYDIMFITL